jgi:hypothetical protein
MLPQTFSLLFIIGVKGRIRTAKQGQALWDTSIILTIWVVTSRRITVQDTIKNLRQKGL